MSIPAKVAERLAVGLKRFQPVLTSAKTRDVNESDTSMIVTDMLAEVFGYDKYHEITRELCIRGTFCGPRRGRRGAEAVRHPGADRPDSWASRRGPRTAVSRSFRARTPGQRVDWARVL